MAKQPSDKPDTTASGTAGQLAKNLGLPGAVVVFFHEDGQVELGCTARSSNHEPSVAVVRAILDELKKLGRVVHRSAKVDGESIDPSFLEGKGENR